MKSKIALFTMLIIIFNSVFVCADDDIVVISNDVFTNLQQEFEYDSKTDTYYFPTFDPTIGEGISPRSGAVAVSGAVISAVLTLAVKAGLEFATTNSMSEFVSRFFMLEGIDSVVSGVSSVVKKSINGTLNFSRSLLDSIGGKFSELMGQKSVSSVYVMGRKLPVVDYDTKIPNSIARYVFESSTVPKISFNGEDITSTGDLQYYDGDVYLPTSSVGGTMSVGAKLYRYSWPYSDDLQIFLKNDGGYKAIHSQSTTLEFPTGTFASGFRVYTVPYLAKNKNGDKFYVGFVTAVYSTTTGFLSDILGKTTYGYIPSSHISSTSYLPVIGDAWSDGVIGGNDSSSSSDLTVSIPKDTNQLANKKPADISTPTYEIWTPGVTIIPPAIDTGTSSPPVDDVLPPITDTPDTDSPGDSGTDKPSSPSLSLDWLKELIQSIIDLIKSIIDWLSNFWTHLWEFLKSLLVPGETYFVDEFGKVTEKMKEKIPSIDITKLEDLAVGEFKFKDIYGTFFGVECLVVRGSVINKVISWARPIIQGLISLFLLLYNYNQIYFLIRGSSLLGASNNVDNVNNNRIGGRK